MMFHPYVEVMSQIDRDLLRESEQRGVLRRNEEATRYPGKAKVESPGLGGRVLVNIGCFLISVGMKLNGREDWTCQPSYQRIG